MFRTIFVVVCLTSVAVAAPSNDEVVNLPGLSDPLNFKHYAGYLTVDESHGRKLFYWFAESQNSPSDDPVVLWLNGGPGCSSLGGLWTENGPFIVNADATTLRLSNTSWNKVANMLWLEAPAGVGFSYSNNKTDYNTGDAQTAADNLVALLQYFKKFPEYAGRKFFIAGESYAGHYIPTLTADILGYNSKNPNSPINLQGILVGNGLTDEEIDFNSPMPYYYSHALISPYTYKSALKACNGNFAPCSGYMKAPPCNPACGKYVNEAAKQIGDLNPYDVIAPVCDENEHAHETQEYRMMMANPLFNPRDTNEKPLQSRYPLCGSDYTYRYLNDAKVKAAIHANPEITWVDCSNSINYNFSHESMLPFYRHFMDNSNIRILIYSGDADSVLPFLGTENWVMTLQRPVTKSWHQWLGADNQQGGFTIEFDRMRFLTIKGAGHMVPQTRPEHALYFFTRFLRNEPI